MATKAELMALMARAWEEGLSAAQDYENGGPDPVNPYED